MSTPTIPAGNLFMNATLYTGNGTGLGSTQTIINGAAGQAFQPDFSWIKNRGTTDYHNLTDIVRGISGTGSPILSTNVTSAETTPTGYGVSALNSNGFTLIGNGSYTNATGNNYVAWQWKAGGTAVSNTSGTITSQVSANTTSGFSVVTWTGNGTSGATIGHGLGVTPQFFFMKNRSAVTGWPTYSAYMDASAPQNYYISMATTNAKTADSAAWNNTAPNSSVITLGNGSYVNGSSMVAYVFAPIAGYSAFGSYTGNGSSDGPFVYLGFRPRFVMIKRTDSAGYDWVIYDTSRNTYNAVTLNLDPNSSAAETNTGSSGMDITSNGFKLRDGSLFWNASGGTYIYACFAENPFKYANAR
jgi:hypothetical protein